MIIFFLILFAGNVAVMTLATNVNDQHKLYMDNVPALVETPAEIENRNK